MKLIIIMAFMTLPGTTQVAAQSGFLEEQRQYKRVRAAIEEKQPELEHKLNDKGLKTTDLNLLLVAYKESDVLEVFAKSAAQTTYTKITSYRICARSGKPGPKRKQGDGQVPEGFYHIDRFNPASNYHLSLGINYPNRSDKRKSNAKNLGNDIFIHGSCVTIGCLPMTDNYIKEIYLMAVYPRNCGQTHIPVYIFPFRMTESNLKKYTGKYKKDTELIGFWKNLKKGYDKFVSESEELNFNIDKNGDYKF